MKRFISTATLVIVAFLILNVSNESTAQEKKVPPSLHASVNQRLGIETDITIDFCRPGVKGRKIWGGLVPYGLAPGNEYSDNNPYPWRAGANKNTTFESNSNLIVEGKKLPAGKYGIHMIPSETDWIVIFSKDNELWGSYKYNQANDALRVTVKSVSAGHQEWMTFAFEDLAGTSATVVLHWEMLKVPFKIEIDK